MEDDERLEQRFHAVLGRVGPSEALRIVRATRAEERRFAAQIGQHGTEVTPGAGEALARLGRMSAAAIGAYLSLYGGARRGALVRGSAAEE